MGQETGFLVETFAWTNVCGARAALEICVARRSRPPFMRRGNRDLRRGPPTTDLLFTKGRTPAPPTPYPP